MPSTGSAKCLAGAEGVVTVQWRTATLPRPLIALRAPPLGPGAAGALPQSPRGSLSTPRASDVPAARNPGDDLRSQGGACEEALWREDACRRKAAGALGQSFLSAASPGIWGIDRVVISSARPGVDRAVQGRNCDIEAKGTRVCGFEACGQQPTLNCPPLCHSVGRFCVICGGSLQDGQFHRELTKIWILSL